MQDLAAPLRVLGSPGRPQNSLFRVPQDARDLVLEKLEDRILANAELPTNLEAWARAVEWNLHRSGPDRRELHRDDLPHLVPETLDTLVAPDPEVYGSCLDPVWLEGFWARLESHLSDEERTLLRAVRAGGRSRDVVRRCGMTSRDVRCRLRRIAEKGKKLAADFRVSAALPAVSFSSSDGGERGAADMPQTCLRHASVPATATTRLDLARGMTKPLADSRSGVSDFSTLVALCQIPGLPNGGSQRNPQES